jgi:amidohydrolase
MQSEMHERIQKTAKMIAESAGATADVRITKIFPVTFNDPDLTKQLVPTLERVTGRGKLFITPPIMGGEDFAYYQEKIPGFFFFLGITPEGGKIVPNHSPHFYVDENAILLGIRAMANLAVDFLSSK